MSETNSFPSQHPWDRNFFLLMMSFTWLALLSGFINDAFLLLAICSSSAFMPVHLNFIRGYL